ncbi:hypothetical protein FIBSPDRAFT_876287 [Athelia psychrophila]|uniref:CBF1-interacting co-repressor CIR N-terminal domain-containing protein n=1 Tax=Athelia psychrophila TaxID=1759441 RepID=A0A167X060_9AGAM|nr:hypothetical protein FIBSPDRAFT_876287 [Fibularhizoctonia sp. CBS 109695]
MGKLNIAHHKSYHPYRQGNIDKVKRDEEEAALVEAKEEGRVLLADSEARIDLLRHRNGLGAAGNKKGKGRDKDKETIDDIRGAPALAGPASLVGQGGHINLFEDLEQEAEETEKGVPLGPPAQDLRPSSPDPKGKNKDTGKDDEPWEERRKRERDAAFKALNDPLASITHQLAARSASAPTAPLAPLSHLVPRPPRGRGAHSQAQAKPRPPPEAEDLAGPARPPPPPITARLTRESSERERARALIERRKREMEGDETPMSTPGGFGGYGDVYNRVEVEAAHRGQRGWDGARDRGRRW